MTYQSRSQYELGDPPGAAIAAEERADHAAAVTRGARLKALANHASTELVGVGVLTDADRDTATVAIFHVLADFLYGNRAIDIPPLRAERQP